MNPELRIAYEKLTDKLEEPIRDIVRGIWGLSFVEDTGYCCCGHVVAFNHDGFRFSSELTSENIGQHWYLHRAMLEIEYSLDPRLAGRRDQFREDLKEVQAVKGNRNLTFNNVSNYEKDTDQRCKKRPYKTLLEHYNATVSDGERTLDFVLETEELLTGFWEGVSEVVKKYNPTVSIAPIAGKNFRKTINWAHWVTVFPNKFKG